MRPDDPAFTDDLRGVPPPPEPSGDDPLPPRGGVPRGPLLVALAGALLGVVFSALSTSDFMQHLDRQVHAIHCSFIPGAAADIGESGCRTVMMSPYSSLFRETVWGGIPISLWALAVFAFLAYRTGLVLWRGRTSSDETRVLFAATAIPVVASVVFGAISLAKLDAVCKVCMGIYAASALCFVGAFLAHRAERRPSAFGEKWLGPALVEGVGLVAAATLAYVVLAPRPDPRASMMGCGSLVRSEDTAGVMIPLTSRPGGTPSIEVLDPLCPSCKAFDMRLSASSLGARLDLKAVLFPLDSACNWMVTEAIHPGACAVSEALLCAAGIGQGQKDARAAGSVLQWAFGHQAELRALAATDERALRSRIEREFPGVKGCLGGALVRSKLTKSLRWAVANAIPVLTPQLFVGDSRMCDEDTDLGLEYTLTRMLSPEAELERTRRRAAHVTPPPPPPPAMEVRAVAEESDLGATARPVVPVAAPTLVSPRATGPEAVNPPSPAPEPAETTSAEPASSAPAPADSATRNEPSTTPATGDVAPLDLRSSAVPPPAPLEEEAQQEPPTPSAEEEQR